jgi:hypothetical protein
MNPKCHSLLLCATFAALSLLSAPPLVSAQSQPLVPDLTGAPGEHGWKLVNRSAALIDKDGGPALRLEGQGGTGFVRLEKFSFADGVIEFDARGRNVVQQSFLGIAFHGTDVQTYDAVYFRPFNFKSTDAGRRAHAVQYVSHPAHTWQKLRTGHPDQYEKPVVPAPDPDGWFHVRVVVAAPKVSVFVNHALEPCLVVDQLSDRHQGWIALWTDVAGGDFANLKITPAP